MKYNNYIISISGVIFFLILAISSGSEKIVYKDTGRFIFDDVDGGEIIYDTENNYLNVSRFNISYSNIKINDFEISKGDYDITKDTKKTNIFNYYCSISNSPNIKLKISIAYTIFDYGYGKFGEKHNGEPSWIYVEIEDGYKKYFAQGPNTYE